MGRLIPEVEVDLGDTQLVDDVEVPRLRRLHEDFNALARFEDVTGLDARSPNLVRTVTANPASPCPECKKPQGHSESREAERDPAEAAAFYQCHSCEHTWPKVDSRENLNAGQWSAYIWALLLNNDPSLDDGSADGGPGLRQVREWLGAPNVLTNVISAVWELEALQLNAALGLDAAASDSEGGGPFGDEQSAGTPSGPEPASTSD